MSWDWEAIERFEMDEAPSGLVLNECMAKKFSKTERLLRRALRDRDMFLGNHEEIRRRCRVVVERGVGSTISELCVFNIELYYIDDELVLKVETKGVGDKVRFEHTTYGADNA